MKTHNEASKTVTRVLGLMYGENVESKKPGLCISQLFKLQMGFWTDSFKLC